MSATSGATSGITQLYEGQHTLSCVACKKRKVKCDKKYPCLNCSRRNSDCKYLASERTRTRGPGKHRSIERLEQMTNRVAQLEHVLEKLRPGNAPNAYASPIEESPNSKDVEVGMDQGKDSDESVTRLEVKGDKSHYIRNRYWATINNELTNTEGLLDDSFPTLRSQDSNPSTSYTLLFGSLGGAISHTMLRPPPYQIPLYWQLFKERVDPVYKFLHRPTVDRIVEKASLPNASISPSNEALLFAIYFTAITSMSSEKVESNFRDSKDNLLARYRCALERSLSHAGLLNTQELGTLQAFALFLISMRRNEDYRTVWTLVGLAVRIAIGMGLQHDGTKFKISPWAIEMRRRLWWIVYMLDVRAAEDQNCEVSIADRSFDTQMPLSIDDEDLDVNATVLPPPRLGFSEMTGPLVRFELVGLGQKVMALDSGLSLHRTHLDLREKLDHIKTVERSLHQKYLQYCRSDIPIAVFIYTMAKFWIAKLSLLVHRPDFPYREQQSHSVPSTTEKPELSRDELFVMSVSILESQKYMESSPVLEQWAWVSRKYVQWHAVAYVLTELSCPSRKHSPLVDRAWRSINGLSRDAVELMADRSNVAIDRPIQKLLARARKRQLEQRDEVSQRPVGQHISQAAELEQWNLQQFQDVGPAVENFDWFLGAPEGSAVNATGETHQLQTPMSLPNQDIDLWNDMTGLLQYQSSDSGAVCGGDWWW